MCQLYSYCLPDLVHRGAEGLVLVKLNCPRKPFMVVFVYFKATYTGKKVIEFLNSAVPDANAIY